MSRPVKMILQYDTALINEAVKQHIERNLGYTGDMEIIYTHKRKLKGSEAQIKIFHDAGSAEQELQSCITKDMAKTAVEKPLSEMSSNKPSPLVEPAAPILEVSGATVEPETPDPELATFLDDDAAEQFLEESHAAEDDFGSLEELTQAAEDIPVDPFEQDLEDSDDSLFGSFDDSTPEPGEDVFVGEEASMFDQEEPAQVDTAAEATVVADDDDDLFA